MRTIQDEIVEGTETFVVDLEVATNRASVGAFGEDGDGLNGDRQATGTIGDEDRATFSIADASAREGEAMEFEITLDAAVAGGLVATPSVSDLTAARDLDYEVELEPIRFEGAAGERRTLSVRTIQDEIVEGTETFVVDLEVATNRASVGAFGEDGDGLNGDRQATGTIVEDDPAPTVTLSLSPDSVSENGGVSTVTAMLSQAADEDTTVTVSAAAVAPAEAADFALAGSTLVIAAGATASSGTVTIAAVDNAAAAPDRKVLVSGTVEGGRGASDPDDAELLIENDDTASLSISETSAVEGETLAFVVTLSNEVTGGFTATPSLFDETATMGTDYLNRVVEVSFEGRQGEEHVIEVPAVHDQVVEGDESLRLSLRPNAPEYVLDPDDATGTIRDNDRAKLSISDASAREGKAIEFAITLDAAVSGGLVATPTVSDLTAVRDLDYAVEIEPIRFEGLAGERRTLSVKTIQDELVEGAETFVVDLEVVANLASIGSFSHEGGVNGEEHATGTIRDDDRAKLSISDASAEEGSPMTFTVVLDSEVPGGLTATPGFTDVSATAGADYLADDGALTFAGTKGETRTVHVETIQDQLVENDETFAVSLDAEAASGVPIETGDGATGTIRDNDETIEVSVSLNPDTVSEGETARFEIALSAPSREVPVTVDYATEDGTATAGADYEPVAGSVTFQPGETWRQIPVLVLDDVKNEPAETFSLRLSNLAGGPTVLGGAEATAFIDEVDPMPAAWLARFGRTAADHIVEAVTERMEGSSTGSGVQVPTGGNDLLSGLGGVPTANGTFGGGTAWAANGGRPVGVLPNGDPSPLRQMTDREFLAASSFTAPLGRAAADDPGAAGPAASPPASGPTPGAPASPPGIRPAPAIPPGAPVSPPASGLPGPAGTPRPRQATARPATPGGPPGAAAPRPASMAATATCRSTAKSRRPPSAWTCRPSVGSPASRSPTAPATAATTRRKRTTAAGSTAT